MHIKQILWARHRTTTIQPPLLLSIGAKLPTLRRAVRSKTRFTATPTLVHLAHHDHLIFLA